eukprot:CAMPEP_0172387552 /NCGR_PEP_ID=MMETSP1061-20121228/4851_1 /TAXON_ID=37318 /ORGANISM="Pseudo-nitzschia pungens, Strain cf. pungens" /LENGTH=312 /DNA_ID=CAMNT_0013117225 /DNA_START=88 /DNA_END=1026 /DNA_ORIENTATION=+
MNFRHEARRRKIGSRPLRSRLVRIGMAGIGMLAVGSSHNSSPFDSRGSRSGSGYACGTIIVAVDAFLPLPRGVRSPGIRPAPEQYGWYLSATNQNESEGGEEAKKKKKKKKKSRRLVINPNLDRDLFSGGSVATITSDGVVKVAAPASTKRATRSSKLGVPTKPRKTKASALPKGANSSGNKRLSAKATKLRNQRTAGGTIDSTSSSSSSSSRRANASASAGPADEAVRIATAKRGSKTVTMVQGMVSASSDERKRLLKKLKARVGGGGTLVEGVLELQGSHAETVLSVLVSEGYAKARVVGGGTNKKKKKK